MSAAGAGWVGWGWSPQVALTWTSGLRAEARPGCPHTSPPNLGPRLPGPEGSNASEPRASTWPGAQPQISTPSVPCRASPNGQPRPSGNKKPGPLQSQEPSSLRAGVSASPEAGPLSKNGNSRVRTPVPGIDLKPSVSLLDTRLSSAPPTHLSLHSPGPWALARPS